MVSSHSKFCIWLVFVKTNLLGIYRQVSLEHTFFTWLINKYPFTRIINSFYSKNQRQKNNFAYKFNMQGKTMSAMTNLQIFVAVLFRHSQILVRVTQVIMQQLSLLTNCFFRIALLISHGISIGLLKLAIFCYLC